MKILHTSDWHLGRMLYGKKRYEEFAAFLNWLVALIQQEQIDCVIVAGDIFDTGTPSNRAQELYYHFLRDVSQTHCRHIIIVAGNHDSPSFLNAPRELLRALSIYVVGNASDDLNEALLLLKDDTQVPQAIICTVPYLRDRDIRSAEAGETLEDKEHKLLSGIQNHYAKLGELAQNQREQLNSNIPIIATGHLFTSGAQLIEGDGVRELYVGSLGHIPASVFTPYFDYVALGHLHIPQKVSGLEHIRYSGSPLPMGFGEATHTKSVCIVEFKGKTPSVKTHPIPCFQALIQLRGDFDTLKNRIDALKMQQHSIWLELIYEGDTLIGNLREQLEALILNTSLEILRIKNLKLSESVLQASEYGETLADLTTMQVFERCLEASQTPTHQWDDLKALYQETVRAVQEAI